MKKRRVPKDDLEMYKPVHHSHLKSAIGYLLHNKVKKKTANSKSHCRYKLLSCTRAEPFNDITSHQLRARNEVYIMKLIRHAILLHDWPSATRLFIHVVRRGRNTHFSTIVKIAFTIILNHPKTTPDLVAQLVRGTTGYVTDEDISDFLRLILMLQDKPEYVLKNEKSNAKVITDPRYGIPHDESSDSEHC